MYLVNGLTNATSQDVAWCPKHQTAKWCCWFDGHCLTRPGSQKTWISISLHRLQIRHSKILLILARLLPIGYFTFYYFSFFLIFNRMVAWSLMRGDAFIHFVSGSRRVNIRLGVLLLIPKSPQILCIPYKIQNKVVCVSLRANALGKGMNPAVLPDSKQFCFSKKLNLCHILPVAEYLSKHTHTHTHTHARARARACAIIVRIYCFWIIGFNINSKKQLRIIIIVCVCVCVCVWIPIAI